MTVRTVEDFKAQHDPRTIIARLEKELIEAREQISTQAAIRELLGLHIGGLDTQHIPKWTAKAPGAKSESPGVPTLFLSDIHAGEVVKPEETPGGNRFNLDVMHKRMRHTVQTAQALCRMVRGHEHIPGIVVALGGDMVSGDIHEELRCTNELPTIPTVLDLYETLVSAINYLADDFHHVFVPCVSGNHGRNTMKTWNKSRNHTSFDWLLYQMLARAFKADPRVKFYVPEGSDALYAVYGTRYLLTHGDQFKAADSIIGPIGPLMRGNQSIDMAYDVMMCGHWHTYMHLPRLIVNGSMKGYDEYAAGWNFPVEPAQQALWLTHPKFGINWRMPVFCDEPGKASPAPWARAFDEKKV